MKGNTMVKTIKDKKNEYIKEEIFSVAKEIVSEQGIENLSIRKIAKKIGYSPGNIYQYYQKKKKQKGIQQLEMYLDEAVEKKEIKAINTQELSVILWSSIVGIILRSIIEKVEDEEVVLDMINTTIDIILND